MYNLLKKYFWKIGNAKQGNFTRVGTPVRVMTKTNDGWRFSAGQISKVHGVEIEIWVFPCTGEKPYIIKNLRNQDFKKKGFPWWSFVVKDYCVFENDGVKQS